MRLIGAVILMGILALNGCATTIRGTTQRVAVATDPPGAECLLKNSRGESPVIVTVTPGEAEVRRDRSPLQVRCTKDGYFEAAESFDSAWGGQGDTETQRRQMMASGTLIGASEIGLTATTMATMAPTVGGGAAVAGAGVVAAPLLLGLLVAAPVAVGVDYATGAAFGYPPVVAILLVPSRFPDEGNKNEYFTEMDRRLDLADEALRQDTEATCAKWNCAYFRKRDEAFINERRTKFADMRAKARIAVSESDP